MEVPPTGIHFPKGDRHGGSQGDRKFLDIKALPEGLARRFSTASTDELSAGLAPFFESGNEMPRQAQVPPLQAVLPTRLPQSPPPALLLEAGVPPTEQSRPAAPLAAEAGE
jgi:hypothetical protein